MDFLYHVFILVCALQRINGLTLGLRNSCGVIGDMVFLDCSLDGATWNSGSNRQWRVSPPSTLLFNGGSPTVDAAGYQEHTSNAGSTGIFSLEITSLTWSHASKGFQCSYVFDTSVYTLSNTDIEDYKNTVANTTDETSGLNIKGTITLDAIYPVPTVQAMLISSSNTDISMKALTNTTSPAPGNLTKVVISVNHLVSNAAHYITVNLSTPCGYSQSFRFNADIETTTMTTEETTTDMNPPEKGLSTGAVIGIVIGVLVVILIVVVVVVCVCKPIKKGNTCDNEDFASDPNQNPLAITNTTTKPPVKLQPLATKDKNRTPLHKTEEQTRKKKKKKQKQVHNKEEIKVVNSDSENTGRKQDDTTGTINEKHQPYGNDDMHGTEATHGKHETLTIFNVDNEKNKTGFPYEKHEKLTAIHIDNEKNKTGIAYEKHEKPTAINIDNENNKTGIAYEKHEKLTAIHIDNENNKTGIAYEKHEKPTSINIDNEKNLTEFTYEKHDKTTKMQLIVKN